MIFLFSLRLSFGHQHYLLTDVPPQLNSPPDNVFRLDRPSEQAIVGFPLSVPVLSWLFDVRGRPPKEPFPFRPPTGMRGPTLSVGEDRAVHQQPTSLGLGPPCPSLIANPFPEVMDPFYRFPMPTLFHRPEVVHLGDLMRNFNPIPFRVRAKRAICRGSPDPYDRLTHVQVSFTWNISPLRASKFLFEYLLLPPTFTSTAAPPELAPKVLQQPPRAPTHWGLELAPTAGYERFALKYRYGPPPEFPLGSPRSGIVHHLSGPDMYAHTRTLLRRSRLFGPCFKMVLMGSPQASVRSVQMPKHAGGAQCLPQSRRRYSMSVSRALALVAPPIHAGPHPELIGGPARRRFTSYRGASPARIRFPPDNFKYSLTLFSKSFSSFPHDTCSLSVCHPYLAMDEIHCPIWAAFPNNPTRRECLMRVIPPDLGSRLERLSAKGSWSPDVRQAIPATTKRVKIQPSLAATSVDVDSHLGQPRARGARESSILPATTAGPVIDARCEGPMRPVIASNFRGLKGRSPSKKLATKGYLRIAMPEALPIQLRPGAHRRQKGRDDRINQVAFLIDADVALAWPAREGADGFKASATIVCKEHRTRQIGVDEVPMPTASTASENPDRRSWTTTSHDEVSKAWYTRAAFRFTPRMKCERRKAIDKT
ncbi:hypothetical protein FXO37_13672 [Capsicum annuum]|nr:hypothetical protein FXO37_13672 [Capsicum annuum]